MTNITGRIRSLKPLRLVLAGAVIPAYILCQAAPASAQMVCMKRENIVKRLADGYGEKQTAVGFAHNGAIIELFTSEKGTFTVILTRPQGMSCLMAAGQDWQEIPALSASPVTYRQH